jgi:hypothetical protein
MYQTLNQERQAIRGQRSSFCLSSQQPHTESANVMKNLGLNGNRSFRTLSLEDVGNYKTPEVRITLRRQPLLG